MPRSFGQKLHYLREQRNMTQEDLARQLGLKRQGHISNLEMGRRTPSVELVVQIADLFGVSTDYLLRDAIDITDVRSSQPSESDSQPVE